MGKTKTLMITVLAIALLPILQGCGGQNPKDIAEEAIKAQIDGNIDKLYNMLSSEDQELITRDNFVNKYTIPNDLSQVLELIPEAKDVFKASKFKETITQDRALITYVLTMPDPEKIGKEVLSLNDLILIAGDKGVKSLSSLPEDVKEKIISYVEKNGVPTVDVTKQMDMIREGEEWKVSLNLKDNLKNGVIPTPFSNL